MWTYVEAANQAHARLNDLRKIPVAGVLKINELETWFQVALGDWDRNQSNSPAVCAAAELLGLLQSDLGTNEFRWTFEDGGDEMTANICIGRASDNRYFALELWWSHD